MRNTFNAVLDKVIEGIVFIDEWKGISSCTVMCEQGKMLVATDFKVYFEVSYLSGTNHYLGGFMTNDEQDEDIWSIDEILDNMVAFCGELRYAR